MRYVMLICADGIPASDQEEGLIENVLPGFVAETAARRTYGHPLLGPDTATTVRVRDGQALLSDGPFIETKEHIAGFDLIECESLEEATEIAARMPVSWFHRIEVRPCDGGDDDWTAAVRERLQGGPAAGMGRYLLLVCVEPSDEEPEGPAHTVDDWVDRHNASGARIVGQVLDRPSSAVTVRVRGPHTLVTEGPFAETKEFVAGFDVIECADLDAATAIAADHPMAWRHMIEVRPFGPSHDFAD
jgi:hypothetical protein